MIRKRAYLTIDDGPATEFRPKLQVLQNRAISAIWFCTGADLERQMDDAVHAIRVGHALGNHSYDHTKFSNITLTEARRQINETDRLIDQAYAVAAVRRPFKAFRFPFLDNGGDDAYGNTRWDAPHVSALQALLGELGYDQPRFEGISYRWWVDFGLDQCNNVDCTFDTMDWVLEDEVTSDLGYSDLQSVLARVDENVPEGGRGLNDPGSSEIIMMHAFIDLGHFRAIIEKLASKLLDFQLPVAR